jgi:hypothetical protein
MSSILMPIYLSVCCVVRGKLELECGVEELQGGVKRRHGAKSACLVLRLHFQHHFLTLDLI